MALNFLAFTGVWGQEPTVQISNLAASNITCNSALIRWTNGNGDRRIIIIKESAAVNQNPSDGTTYNSNSLFGNGQELGTGNFVVFIGPVSLVNVQGLKPNTTYHIKAYEYFDNGGTPDYLPTSPPVNSFTTLGISMAFSKTTQDSCWYNNGYNFINNSVSTFPSTNYKWDFGDGNTTTTANPSHVYTKGGVYKISLTVFPDYGCKDTAFSISLVIPEPTIDIGVNDSTQCLTGNQFDFTNNTIYPNINKLGLQRTWSFGDGTTDVTAKPKKKYTYADTFDIYNYIEMVYNNRPSGCYDTGTFKVIVFPNPAGSVTVSDTIHCIGKNTLIFDNPATNVISYHWDFGDGNTNSNKTASHQYSATGDYVVIHTAESSFGCISKDTVNVYSRNRKISSFVGLSGPICNSQVPIPLIASDLTGTFIGKGVSGLSYIPNNIGRDTVFYIVPDAFCPDTTSVIVDVLLSPSPNLGSDQNLCNQPNISISESIPGTYLWSDGSSNNNILITKTGTYWLEVNDGICAGRDSVYIYFGQPPVLPAISDTFICKNSFIAFRFSNFDTKYLWNDGSTDSFKLITSGGLYSVTATNPCGTTNATFNVNQLEDDCNVLVPNAFSPNGDGINDLFTPVLLSDSIIIEQMIVFNTYGEILFKGDKNKFSWDGKYQEELVQGNQNYYYLIYYTLPIPGNNQKGKLSGSVYIIE